MTDYGKPFIQSDKLYRKLKRAYYQAVDEGKEQFEFEKQPLLTKFCKYLLQYVENSRSARGLDICKRISNGMLMKTKFDEKYKQADEVWKNG